MANPEGANDERLKLQHERLLHVYEQMAESGENNDKRIDRFVRGMLRRILFLASSSDASLEKINNFIENYALNKLASKNTHGPDSARAARFMNGAFFSMRISEGKDIVQHDVEFYKNSVDPLRPRIISRPVNSDGHGNFYASLLRQPSFPMDNELHDSPIPRLVIDMKDLAEKEASESFPNAYSRKEIVATRKAMRNIGIRQDQIRISPYNNEPYL